MTRGQIEELDRCFPKPNPYTRWLNREQERNCKSGRLLPARGLSLFAPALGWQVAKSFADEGQSLPPGISPAPWLRANQYLLNHGPADLPVALAHMLSLPASRPQSVLLQALMLCDGAACEDLAALCGYDVEVIQCYDALFWNVLERKEERDYIDRIYPHGSPAASRDGSPIDLLALAHKSRRIDVVLTVAEFAHPAGEPTSLAEQYQKIQHNCLVAALHGLALGAASEAENPALKPALKIISKNPNQAMSSQKEQQTANPGDAILLAYQRHLNPTKGDNSASD